MPWLEIVTDDGERVTHVLREREVVVGRHPTCDIVLRDTTISRRHARVYCDGPDFYVEDLGSQHGTQVNEDRLTKSWKLVDQDEIHILDARLVFHSLGSPESSLVFTDEFSLEDRPSTILSSRSGVLQKNRPVSTNIAQQLGALLEITHNLGVLLDVNQIFPKILESLFRIFPQASRGYILLLEGPDGRLVPRAIKQASTSEDDSSPVSFTIAKRVMEDGQAILSGDAANDERFRASESIYNLKLRSIMCAPLMSSSSQPLGMIQINTEDRQRQFTPEDLDVLVNVANLAGQAVDHARLHESQLDYDRRERDVETAQQVQLHFLPQNRPELEHYEFQDFYKAAQGVGGDYFGYIELPDGRLGIAMGDVAGKGIPAALLMARLCSDVRYCLATNPTAADATAALNDQIANLVSFGRFITFALCVLDPIKHEVTVVNAGHMSPLLLRAKTGEVTELAREVSGPPLGVTDEFEIGEKTYALEPGDAILLYTDGVNEAMNANRELYGEERIAAVMSKCRGNAQCVVEGLAQDVQAFSAGAAQNDDICIVGFSRNQSNE